MAIVSSRIKALSLQLANQIAAGEVVERPASVVKELLENAIDAHSQQIDIDIERGGSALIRISDDGDGINKDDLSLAVTRHATSKLQTLGELEQIMSLGFRGEALASISAVSRLSIKSKQTGQQQAWMIDTGTDSDFANYTAEPEPAAHPLGTTIDIRDLFFNTPARRKFMRTIKTEFRHIDDIVKRIALSQFDIAFKLTHNKKLLRNLPKAVTEKAIIQRICKLFSPEFISHANKVDFSTNHYSNMGTLRLWGWISAPQWHRKQADWQYFYVNGRYIKDKLVNHALRQAYQELLPEDTFSAYLLYLEIDPQQVDVNVHPTKHEVRFRQSRLIHDFIYSALKDALFCEPLSLDPINQTQQTAQGSAQEREYINQYSQSKSHQLLDKSLQPLDNSLQPGDKSHQLDKSHQPLVKSYQPKIHSSLNQNHIAEQIKGMKQLYQAADPSDSQLPATNKSAAFFGSSLGCLIPDYLMSQNISEQGNAQIFVIHILRAQQYLLRQLFQPGQCVALLIPETLVLMNSEIESLLKYQIELQQWGLELSQLGDDTLLIRGLPSLYGIPGCTIDTDSLITIILQHIKTGLFVESAELMVALMNSIHSDTISYSEQEKLLNLLAQQVNQSVSEQISIDSKAVWKILDKAKLDKFF